MATAKKKAEAPAEETKAKGQGRAVTLPNGVKRIDFIRDAYYNDGKERSAIKNEINDMYEEGSEGIIAYQIVFAATKEGVDPRTKVKEAAKAEK